MSCLFYRAAGRSREERAEGKYKSRAMECVDYPPSHWSVLPGSGWQDAAPDIPDGLGFGWGFWGVRHFQASNPLFQGGCAYCSLLWRHPPFRRLVKLLLGAHFSCVQVVAERKLMGGLPILRMQP